MRLMNRGFVWFSRIFGSVLILMGLNPLRAQDDLGMDEPPPVASIVDDFESAVPTWREEQTDTSFLLKTHERSALSAHDGRQSERFVFEAGAGSVLYYSYRLPRIPLTDALKASLYVRSNRTGVRLYARVVLPDDKDPDTGQPAFLLISGTSVDTPDRWQRVEISSLPLAVDRQARVLRAGSSRPVRLSGAYVDRLVINLYGGPGASEILLDDLNVSPVPKALADLKIDANDRDEEPAQAAPTAPTRRDADRVQLQGTVLLKDKQPWFPRGISASGADLASIRRAGFDVIELPVNSDADQIRKAADLGFLVMPRLSDLGNEDETEVMAAASAFPGKDSIAFWNQGDDLGRPDDRDLRKSELEQTRRRVLAIRRSSNVRSHLSFGTVIDQLPQYALYGRNLDLIGIELSSFGGSLEPLDFYRDLRHARQSTATKNPNALFWAWIPAGASSIIRQSVWGEDVPPGWGWPTVQPDQIRMLTYAALMAGYRGVGYRGDAELGRPGGLARLYELTLLIAEIELLEPLLARASEPPSQWSAYPPDPKVKLTYNPKAGTAPIGGGGGTTRTPTPKEVNAYPTIKVACIDSEDHRTKLLLVSDLAPGGQWQPTQMGYRDLNLLIPAPESAQAFEISLGEVQALESRRDTGGRRITIPVFNGTSVVVVTTDLPLIDQLRAKVESLRPRAVDIAIKQAELEYQQTITLNGQMASQGIAVRNSSDLLDEASRMIQSARDAMERQDYPSAWIEARSVSQPLRMVTRSYFDRAYREVAAAIDAADTAAGLPQKRPRLLLSPVACPPLVARETLPHYAYWLTFIKGSQGEFGSNRIPTGTFDATPGELKSEGWSDASHPSEGFKTTISIDQRQGVGPTKSALKLSVTPSNLPDRADFKRPDGQPDGKLYEKARQLAVDALAPIHTLPIAAVRSPTLQVKEKDFIRIRVFVKMPRSQTAGSTGLVVRDNLGGELLQFRTSEGLPQWREVVLFRRVPSAGEFHVTLGLAGTGEVYFDNFRVEVLGDPAGSPGLPPEFADDEPLARRLPLPNPGTPSMDASPTRR